MERIVYFEYCTSCEHKSCCKSQDRAIYTELLDKCKQQILSKIPSIKICVNKLSADKTGPRVGSFEIVLGDRQVFSKLQTGKWPIPSVITNHIYTLLEKKNTDVLKQTVKFPNINQRAHFTRRSSMIQKPTSPFKSTAIPQASHRIPVMSPNLFARNGSRKINTNRSTRNIQARKSSVFVLSNPLVDNNTFKENENNTIKESDKNPFEEGDKNPFEKNENTQQSPLKNFEEERKVSKTVEVCLDINLQVVKKLTFFNSLDSNSTYFLHSFSKFITIHEPRIEIPSGKKHQFKITFLPVQEPDEKQYFLNVDRDGMPYETVEIIATYAQST